MSNPNFVEWLEQLQCQALSKFQRQLVLLVGDACWVKQLLQLNEKTQSKNAWLVFSHHQEIPATINNKHFAQQLGSEHRKILFSGVENTDCAALNSINLDAFAALSGTLVAGGVMFLWLKKPLIQAIEQTKLASLKYFYQQLLDNKTLITITQNDKQTFPLLDNITPAIPATAGDFLYHCKTKEQQIAVEHIIKVSQGHRNRPLVLTADRGRGKSSALAIACVELITNNTAIGNEKIDIVITAPHVRSLSVFYRQLACSLATLDEKFDYVNASKTALVHRLGSITFVAVDQLLRRDDALNVSLLLVDEAAAIPVHLLTSLTTRFSRVVFSSTVHGYEGAGRGFTVKFQQELTKQVPQWRSFHMHQPIRWRQEDPLEVFVFESCLLNAKLAELPAITQPVLAKLALSKPALSESSAKQLTKASLSFSQVSSTSLIENTALLKQVFAVLVTAHYQTSPNDITLLLDNKALQLFIAKLGDDIVGVALLLEEGCNKAADIKAIATNQRRLKNQFIPQSLLTHCGFSESFNYQYLRVLRIAIHPQYHRYGFGSCFIKALETFAKKQQVDFIGASFGANAQLLKFWQDADYQIARIGFTKDQASGEHSALVVSAMSDRGQFFERKIASEFYSSFDYLLTDEYQGLSAKLVWQILHHYPDKSLPQLSAHQLSSINDFILQKRQFSHCVKALHYWCLLHCKENYQAKVLLLIERILQKKPVDEVCKNHQLTGKKMLNKALIDYIAQVQAY
ncbi:GNAT family N-acetyltransferase [Colwellia hornerae]|uniref:tRNA(Met) cytidine acetyltransferase TmcA n=1 Tax=Colwellia hornerae TaxID=89402 RepID=A0A5C6Q8U0_9GAMM|nr:GNAT family N-acetyltransferase [Colwellia hornerae]TWX50630.1 tRNA(Met) cytidine acetyltransferase [Colwellia hornerae]TWX56372.1 tRNA(Met) cytidine acetyltransferase [Colwellia hornerae]TWX65346.1 tRNA(Met) cytidine acetyltransferase [Colwellia hornerae]